MDSLLATYASSDDDADSDEAPSTAPAASSGGRAGGLFSLPQPKSAPALLFSSLPAPKSTPEPLFSSLSAPKSANAPTFSSIPAPKTSGGNPKRVVQYRPQPILQSAGDSSDDDEDDAKKRRASNNEASLPHVSAGLGPVSSFLPPPKHSLGLGSGSGAGARRSAIDTAAPEKPNLSNAVPSSSVTNTGAPERPSTGASDDDDSEDSGSEGDMPAPELEEEHQEQPSFNAAAAEQQQGHDAGAGSTSGYGTYAWDPNYYAQYGANYGWDPSASASYEDGTQYAAYEEGQSGGYAHSHGGEHGSGYEHVAAVPYGVDYTGGYGHEVAATALPPVQEPVLPPEMGRIGGKRGRNDMPAQILEVNQAELMKNRPKQDKSKLTGLAFGPSYQPAPSAKGKPSKLHKRKHQIGSLYFDMKSKEMELAERRSKGILTKAETQAKYGW
ncbi:uncharacterized protein LOC100275702 [Zea mays]|uniref:Proline-rich protein PRCC n=2 Tax=Zea mays TaxID=4577 RepID=A0A1D6H1V2_MAIZE|nr:uncharacterized protein LOC100275702 [Zea mays]AQK68858.1 hypothetical protein ZEAMMB73_Zm00001d015433 [Zea mays]